MFRLYQSRVLKGQCDLRVPERDLPLPPELRDLSRNVGDDELDAQLLKLVDGVNPNTSCTVGRWYSFCTLSVTNNTKLQSETVKFC